MLVRLYFEVFSPKRVVAAFLTQLTHREAMVGLALAIGPATACLPTLLFSHRMENKSLRMPYYALGARLKWVSLFGILISVLTLSDRPLTLAWTFIALLGVFGLGDAVGGPAFGDVVARTVPPGRRGRMFGLRVALGGVLAFFAGDLIRRLLGPDSPWHFPYNYFALFGAAFAFLVAAQFCFMQVDEPVLERPSEERPPLGEYLRAAVELLRRDRNAWGYCLYRNLSPLGWVPAAFIIPYALDRLHFHAGVVGLLVSTGVVASSVSNLFWGSLGDRHGNRRVLVLSSAMLLMAAALLALTPLVSHHWPVDHGNRVLLFWLLTVNALGEIGLTGAGNGQLNYLYDLAPDDRVPIYVGAVSTAAAPMMVAAPLLIGFVVSRCDYQIVFTLGVVFSLAVVAASLLLGEPRPGRGRRRGSN